MRKEGPRIGPRIGIDASNLRAGGGFNHLPQILEHAPLGVLGEIVVWCNERMAEKLPNRTGIRIVPVPALERGLAHRTAWQQWRLPKELLREKCDALFSPGGTLPRRLPVPSVTMSRNMLPFEEAEFRRYAPWTLSGARLRLLRRAQCRSMGNASGVIFLTEYAKRQVVRVCPKAGSRAVIIPHGVDPRFRGEPKAQQGTPKFTADRPFRFLYVSTVDLYKHQWQVARAAAQLKSQGAPIEVRFIGSAFPEGMALLQAALNELDPGRTYLKYEGAMEFSRLHQAYQASDAFIFASSCENLPNILLEAMAAGLPIASSDRGPMPEVLSNAGAYFDPEKPESIARALESLFYDPMRRTELARRAFERAAAYSWEKCAKETFSFILGIIERGKKEIEFDVG